MTWLQSLNPIPAFPAYTGAHAVGSVDIEIAAEELEDASVDGPPIALPTVAFRVFYPCTKDGDVKNKGKAVRWIPNPQREYISAYARFLGANNAFASMFSLFPQLLNHTTIPVQADAALATPQTSSKRWPVVVFSHGLGGSRNAYSHFCGSLASHGVVVVAPDHRDGSAPVSFVHAPGEKKARAVEYRRIDHKASTETYEARDEQLRVRLWEMGMLHSALLKLDNGAAVQNLVSAKGDKDRLGMFKDKLAVHEPGTVAFAGHSFGACTTVQLLKSVFYRPATPVDGYKPLFTPSATSPLATQITPATPTILLDLWTLPVQSPSTTWLRSKPMPAYATPTPSGAPILSVLSEAFYKWSTNMRETLRILDPPAESAHHTQGPHLFYPESSAHLSQSDFGVLFPWATAKAFGAREPERILRLNVRAALQVLRGCGWEVAGTSRADREVEGGAVDEGDRGILEREGIRGWVWIGREEEGRKDVDEGDRVSKGPGGAVIEGEVLGEVVVER